MIKTEKPGGAVTIPKESTTVADVARRAQAPASDAGQNEAALRKKWDDFMPGLDPRAKVDELTPERVRSIAEKIAARVSADTGWPIDLSKLSFDVLPSTEVMKTAL